MKDFKTYKKASNKRRVSHRRELAVVTFGMIASIAGISGLLTTTSPASQAASPGTAPTPAQASVTAPVQTSPSQYGSGRYNSNQGSYYQSPSWIPSAQSTVRHVQPTPFKSRGS